MRIRNDVWCIDRMSSAQRRQMQRFKLSKRAGQLTEAELEQIQTVMTQPKNFKIPVWFLNRRRDWKDGKDGQMTSNNLDNKLREDLERMKKIRLHRGIRHWWGVPVKGQKTKTSGRHGRTVGVQTRKK